MTAVDRARRLLVGGAAAQERAWMPSTLAYHDGHMGLLNAVHRGTTYGRTEPVYLDEGMAYTSNGVAFAVAGRRIDLFCQARFRFKRYGAGPKPMNADLFSTAALAPLDNAMRLLTQMEIDVATAGNAFVVRDGTVLRRLSPLSCTVVLGSQRLPGHPDVAWDGEPVGLIYSPPFVGNATEVFTWAEVAHYAPKPDPDNPWRGMSYLRPVLTEATNTNSYNRFITKYWENNATPNMAVVFPPEVQLETIQAFRDAFQKKHAGVERSFRTAFLGGGADVKMIGANLRDLSATEITSDQFAKICAAAGVPPVVVTIVPGLEAASTYANYQTAMRAFADLTVRPLWAHAVAALGKLVPAPSGAELWYDVSGVSALQQDAIDDAQVMQAQAQTMRTLVDGGFVPDSVITAVTTGDLTKVQHSGLLSVQTQAPGTGGAPLSELHVRQVSAFDDDDGIEVRASDDGDGLTLAGYIARFGQRTDIDDWLGSYTEEIKRGAFARTIAERGPAKIKMQFNHGHDPAFGTLPIGVWTDLREDRKGLWGEGRVHDTWHTIPIRAALESGALDGMSFKFKVVGETWRKASKAGETDHRTLTEVALFEAGVVVHPAYDGTSVKLRSRAMDLWRTALDGRELSQTDEACSIGGREAVAPVGDTDPNRAEAGPPVGITRRELRRMALSALGVIPDGDSLGESA